ncbi:MAG: bifunctional riboflavin kinase/FAD synthetase [Gammaproteobacteria bacterium]|nr:bifunctional riboflavin kinase/FAD synthetase [Gammaproteobacteria bacterium]
MELIRGVHNLRPRHRGCVATIGNYDGVHLGHRAVLDALIQVGRQRNLPTAVMAFEPTPQEFFGAEKAPARLTRFREKFLALAETGMDRFACLRFNNAFAALSPDEFVERILVDGMGVRYLVAGDDFRYGRKRMGDFASLKAAGRKHGFELQDTASFQLDGERVSSSRIREALEQGRLEQATRLLGRPYSMCGKVVRGDQLGRTLGFPTANILPSRRVLPMTGVYAVWVAGVDSRPWPAVANLGTRPTVNGKRALLEAHLLDFDGDIYGRHLEVRFVAKLRNEHRFETLHLMIEQMHRDLKAAREILSGRSE